jgi:hypothetical protein
VKVDIHNAGTGIAKLASSDERGAYLLNDLQPGTYKITVSAASFATRVLEGATRLDGATISYPWLPRLVAYLPPVEAVETVNLVGNSFDAGQAMAGGAAMNVTIKSGANEYHGRPIVPASSSAAF